MKKIYLTQNQNTLIDDEDYDSLIKWNWRYLNGYAVRNKPKSNGRLIFMHRELINTPPHLVCDHINRNSLDNRKENLRSVTKSEDLRNRTSPNGLKGVTFRSSRNRWQAQVRVGMTTKYLGSFKSKIEAHEAYQFYNSVES